MPAGTGRINPILRYYRSDRVFPSSRFGSTTEPGTSVFSEKQLKITGEHNLGAGWALRYDLRAATVSKTKTRHGTRTTATATGLQDQAVGVVRDLTRSHSFVNALAVSIVLPTGSTTSDPQLGVGHLAVEPNYGLGIAHRFGQHRASGSLSIGPRLFFDSGIIQWRASAGAGVMLTRSVDVFTTLFLARTVGANSTQAFTPAPNASEVYNVLRGGLGVRFSLTPHVRPMVEYETDLAGQSNHAGSRLMLGVSARY